MVGRYYAERKDVDPPDTQTVQELQLLLGFDNIIGDTTGQIPLGATITNATLQFETGDNRDANSGGPYAVAKMLE